MNGTKPQARRSINKGILSHKINADTTGICRAYRTSDYRRNAQKLPLISQIPAQNNSVIKAEKNYIRVIDTASTAENLSQFPKTNKSRKLEVETLRKIEKFSSHLENILYRLTLSLVQKLSASASETSRYVYYCEPVESSEEDSLPNQKALMSNEKYISRQQKLFERYRQSMVERYNGEYVWFEDGKVLAHDSEESKLVDYVEDKVGEDSFFIKQVLPEDPRLQVISPFLR